jgi:hypothetical protein
MNLTAEFVVSGAAILISIIAFYIPAYQKLEAAKKQLVMLGAMAIIAFGALGLSCTGLYGFLTCDLPGLAKAAELFALAVVANVTTYRSTKHVFEK